MTPQSRQGYGGTVNGRTLPEVAREREDLIKAQIANYEWKKRPK